MIGALIGAGGSIASSLLGGIFGSSSTKATNRALILMMRENQQWQEKMMDKLNEYNAPVNLLGLYEAAGYNPLTALNNMSGVSASAGVSSVSTPLLLAPDWNTPFSLISNHLMNYALMESQIKKNEADAGYTRAQQQTEDLLRQWRVQEQEWRAKNTLKENQLIDANISNIKATEAYTNAQAALSDVLKQTLEAALPYIAAMNQAQLDNLLQQLENAKLAGELTKEQIAYYDIMEDVAISQVTANYAAANASNAAANASNAQADYIAGAQTAETEARTNLIDEQGDTEVSKQSANYAAARQSETQAELNEQFKNIGGKAAQVIITGAALAGTGKIGAAGKAFTKFGGKAVRAASNRVKKYISSRKAAKNIREASKAATPKPKPTPTPTPNQTSTPYGTGEYYY